MMNVLRVQTEADYDWALKEIEQYFQREPKPGTPDAERFDALAMLVEAYEAQHWRLDTQAATNEKSK